MGDLLQLERPELVGKPLRDEFQGYYRITFGRYRIIYRVLRGNDPVLVEVVLVGLRKQGDRRDVYERLRRMLRRGES